MYHERDVKRHMLKMYSDLSLYGSWKERTYGLFRIEKMTTKDFLEQYLKTIQMGPNKLSIEPIATNFIDTTNGKKAKITAQRLDTDEGSKVWQIQEGTIREEWVDFLTRWYNQGAPFFAGGGISNSWPTKSYDRTRIALLEYESELMPVLKLIDDLDVWWDYWSWLIAHRMQWCDLVYNSDMPDPISRGNPNSGTGLFWHGKKRERWELDRFRNQLQWTIPVTGGSGMAFAVTAAVDPGDGYVWNIVIEKTEQKGTAGNRSDFDGEVHISGDQIVIEGLCGTRQIVGLTDSIFVNQAADKYVKGMSFNSWVKQQYFGKNLTTPGDINALINLWVLRDNPNDERICIGQDFGKTTPVKLGADGSFCKATITIGGRTFPLEASGAWHTSYYLDVIAKEIAKRIDKFSTIMINIIDDMPMDAPSEHREDVLDEYRGFVKVKGSTSKGNKTAGHFTMIDEDIEDKSEGETVEGIHGWTGRVVSSKASSKLVDKDWVFPELPNDPTQKFELEYSIPERIEQEYQEVKDIATKLNQYVIRGGSVQEVQLKMKQEIRTRIKSNWDRIQELISKGLLPNAMRYMLEFAKDGQFNDDNKEL